MSIATMLRRTLIAGLATVLMSIPADAQSRADVFGTVVDSSGVGLRGATVVALAKPDSVIAKFAITAGDGAFRLRRVPTGEYVLQVTFVGYGTYTRDMALVDSDIDAGTIAMQESAYELDALVVTAEHIPIVVKRDTLEYNADAFGMRANSNVEDLLRRLPGVEVRDDGSIRAQGEDVENVLVDGKEFFGGDPTIATKNLPADAVDKVQVYDKQSDMAEFTGVDDGQEEKTINLALKEDAKQGYFGQMSGGYGDQQRYDGQASVNRFSPTTQLSVIANVNNINRQGFSPNDYIQFMGGLQGLMVDGGLRLGGAGVPLSSSISDGFSETFAVGLNANRDFGSGTSIRSSYFVSRIDNLQNRTVEQEQILGSTLSSRVSELSRQTSDNFAHRLNLNAKHEFTAGRDLRFRGNLTVSNSTLSNGGFRQTVGAAGLTQNTSQTLYDTSGDDLGGQGSLTLRQKLNERGTALVAEARLDLNESDRGSDLASTTGFFEPGDVATYNELLQDQELLSNTVRQSQRLSLSHPLPGKRVLELSARREEVSEDQTKSIFDLTSGLPVLDSALSSGFDRTYSYLRGGFRLQQNGTALSIGVGLDVQESQLEGVVRDVSTPIEGGYTHLLPSASLRYEIRSGMSVDLRYNSSTREPSMYELQPFVDNSDPLNVYVGNPALEPEVNHRVGFHYMYFDQFSFTNLFAFANVVFTNNAIVRSRTIDEFFSQRVTSVNSDGSWTMNGTLEFGRPMRPLRAKMNVSTRAMYSRANEILNAEENRTNIVRNTVEARLENRTKDIWDLRGGARYTFNTVDYSLNEQLNQSYVNRTWFADATLYLGTSWEFSTSLNYRLYDQDVFGSQDNVALFEARVSRIFMDERAEIQLIGLDLLNQNQGVNFSNAATYVQEERIDSLGRYLMLKLVYRLSDIGRSGGGVEFHGVGD